MKPFGPHSISTPRSVFALCAAAAGLVSFHGWACNAQMVFGEKMPGYSETFGLTNAPAPGLKVEEIGVRTESGTMANVLLPGETAHFILRLTNTSGQPLAGRATLQVIQYGTSVPAGDVWVPHVFAIRQQAPASIDLNVPGKGFQDIVVAPVIPESFGGYGLVLDAPGRGRFFVATLARVIAPDPGRVQFPTFALDTDLNQNMNEGIFTLFEKLGIKGIRLGTGYSPKGTPALARQQAETELYMGWARKHNITAMMTLSSGGADPVDQPMGTGRPWLSPANEMLPGKSDEAWMPSYDPDFQHWVTDLSARYGWPKGNLNAVELWNEPWDGHSISGWGADTLRYREIYTQMALGVIAAREQAGVKVLIGGTCSSSNARDKLFSDGDDFLKWFDFVSVHYQPLSADPALEPTWMNRKGPYGPVKVWDTESWISNSEDRVAGVIASMRAQGQLRTAGVYRGNVYTSRNLKLDGKVAPVVQVWSPAAAIAATQKYIGQRAFQQILFKNGLPWVFMFDGLPDEQTGAVKPEDGTAVIVGDLARIYPPDRVLFHSVQFTPQAKLTLSDAGGRIRLIDFYGNPVASKGGIITIPLNGLGFFLRPDGSKGSSALLQDSLRQARIEGLDPVQIVAHDLTASLDQHPMLTVTLTNVLNRPVTGSLSGTLAGARLTTQTPTVTLAPNTTVDVPLTLGNTPPTGSNTYPLLVAFDAGKDGTAKHQEDMHVNLIAHRTIKIDGDLSDWVGILPQVLPGSAIKANLTEQAYLPFVKDADLQADGLATVYLAYDDQNFYFAAKVSDTTPDPGMMRFATRDDDSFFYPDEVISRKGAKLTWPAGVRHFSYRRNFEVPAGTSKHDNIQIAFNVLPEDKKPWTQNPPGTMPRFMDFWDTDYEFALNPVAPEFSGGVEFWRLLAPGMRRMEDFPREPKGEHPQGPVQGGQLVMQRTGNVRLVEAAIPWSEIPEVQKRMQRGLPIKFSCRVNDNQGAPRELATGRSVSKENGPAFHDSWQSHWANELEFNFEPVKGIAAAPFAVQPMASSATR